VRADRATGLAVIALGLIMGLASTRIPVSTTQQLAVSARFFPYLLSGAMVVFGLALFFRPGEKRLKEVLKAILVRQALVLGGLIFLYLLTFRHVDFRFGAWAFMLAAMWTLGSRKPLELIVMPLAVSAGVYLMFRYGFLVLLPTWT
jgi:putative tricarboxylic transport membrane protein